ncbi:unnamed protein product [Cyclocybe aegerita]|uniref:Uncharacterized protein n=1 Tax=Cyclocybe aegerita TaxID=1973307 RepID=A0A8S0W2F7_CYCAE|nr:unnamed protein product [Cyclocybe aegerita]
MLAIVSLAVFTLLPQVSGHSAFFHPSMWGFNVTDKTFDYDNRPVAPIKNMNFDKWWFHNHLDYPPNEGDFFELPAGKPATAEIACNKGATSYFASSEGGDVRDPNNPNNVCPNSGTEAYHTLGFDDLEGCALAIAYKSDVKQVQPEDFTIFSVNQTCVWTRFTDFQVPARMPPCPEGGCICSFFWIHSPNSGGEENYMNGFRCNVTGSISDVPPAKPTVARRCGADPVNNRLQAAPANCTYGAKQPFYWFNNERNNMFEGTYSPPVYNDRYNFLDGAQDDIFIDSYLSIPTPAPNAAMPLLADVSAKLPIASINDSTNAITPRGCGQASTSLSSGAGSTTEYAKTKRDMSDAHRPWSRSRIALMSRRSRKLDRKNRRSLWNM